LQYNQKKYGKMGGKYQWSKQKHFEKKKKQGETKCPGEKKRNFLAAEGVERDQKRRAGLLRKSQAKKTGTPTKTLPFLKEVIAYI